MALVRTTQEECPAGRAGRQWLEWAGNGVMTRWGERAASMQFMALRPSLLEVLRDRIRAKHYSPRTEEAYSMWVRRYVRYYRGRHPRDLGPTHVRDFLTHLARDGGVAASTQNQALAALLFLYGAVLEMPIAAPFDHMHAKRPMRLEGG